MNRAAAAAVLLVAVATPVAGASGRAGYDRIGFREPDSAGRPVDPPLEEFKALAGARVIVPRNWAPLRTRGGRPRYLTSGSTCRFRVTWSVRSVAAEPGDAEARLDEALAAPPRAHVYEAGERNGRPWRVVKMGRDPTDRVRGAWVAVLTRRKDIAPDGKVVWAAVTADARARAGDECHSGTIRNAARDIADGLSVATVRLKFVRR